MTDLSRRRLFGLLGATALTPILPAYAAPKPDPHAAIMALLNERMDAAYGVMQKAMEDAIVYGTGPLKHIYGPSHTAGGLADLVQVQEDLLCDRHGIAGANDSYWRGISGSKAQSDCRISGWSVRGEREGGNAASGRLWI